MIYTINNCIRAFGYTNFDNLIADMGSVDNLREYVRANGYADIAVAEDTELLLVDVNGKTWHTGCYGAVIEPPKPYLCFTSAGDSTVAMTQNGTPNTSANKVIQYKLNNGRWQNWDLSEVSLHDGDKMYLKSDDEIPISESESIYKQFVMTGSIAASGNIMSLLNFSTTLTDYAFCKMFDHCSSLTQAPELPATTLATSCYARMFAYCNSLTSATELPATTLTERCYESMFMNCTSLKTTQQIYAVTAAYKCCYAMFYGCTSLTAAPELPATTLADACYNLMFRGCTALTQAPALPAITLAVDCYNQMFYGCSSLTIAPELPATTLVNGCYTYMFVTCSKLNYVKAMFTTTPSNNYTLNWLQSVSSTGTFVKNANATWNVSGDNGIPTGWTVQVEGGVTPGPEPDKDYLCFTSTGDSTVAMTQEGTPNKSAGKLFEYKLNGGQWQTWDLSAVSLADGDKMYLRSGDTIPMGESDTTYKNFSMTGSIAASGNVMSLLNFSTTLTTYAFYYLFSGCSSLTTAPALPATTLAEYCYQSMFNGCTSLTTAPELPATTLAYSCYRQMFEGCTSLTQAPALPATTLEYRCYKQMFYNCTSLTAAPELPATRILYDCYYYMFNGCTKLNYVKALFTTMEEAALTDWLSNVSPTGTFVKNSAATWTNEQAGIPTGWTVQTASPDK